MSSIEETLEERGNRYGSFYDHASIAQNLQDVMRKCEGWDMLAPDQKQALTVISDKIARMLNGQPDYRDNWHDIVGYAKLVDDRLALNDSERITPEQIAKALAGAGGPLRRGSYDCECLGCGKFHDPSETACWTKGK